VNAITVDPAPLAGRPPVRDVAGWLPRHSVCLAIYAASIAALLLSPLGHHWPFVDLSVYRDGGRAILDGTDLYALRFPGALAFTYPPLSALAFTPLAVLGMSVLKPCVTAGSCVLLFVMLRCALRLAPVDSWLTGEQATRLALLAAAAALWLEPVWTTLRYGQIDLLIGSLVLYDLSRPDASRWKGVGVGLAIGLKLTPVIFTAYLLLTRRYRAAATSLAVFGATILVGFAAVWHDAGSYWGGAFIDPGRVGRIENAANQTLRGAYARLLHSVSVGSWWLPTAAIVGLVGIGLAVRAGRRGDDARGFALCVVSGLLVSPVSWSHHWVLAIPALMLLALASYRSRALAGVAGALLVAAIGYSHMIWWVPVNHPRHSELHLGGLQLAYADSYVLVGLAALLAAAIHDERLGLRRAMSVAARRPAVMASATGVRRRRPGSSARRIPSTDRRW
jgi:alpha-1,2-mannosyltransferase